MLRKTVYIFGKLGLVIGSLVFVDNISFGQTIQHGAYFLIEAFGFFFVRGLPQSLDKCPGRGCIIPVPQSFHTVLPDPL